MQALDTLDKRLLKLVQHDASLTAAEIGEQIGLSASAVQRRLKRLQTTGVISRTTAILDPARAGRPMFFIVGLEVEKERSELLTRLRAWLAAEDSVQQSYYVTGSADFMLVVTARSVESYDGLMSRLMADNPNVRRFTTNVALAVHKRSLTIPVD